MVIQAHRLRTLLNKRPGRLLPKKHHSHRSLPHVPTPPPFNISTSTCEMPCGSCPSGQTPSPATHPKHAHLEEVRTPLSHPERLNKQESQTQPFSRAGAEGVREGRDTKKNFLLKFFFQRLEEAERIPTSTGLRRGGGEPPQSFNAR